MGFFTRRKPASQEQAPKNKKAAERILATPNELATATAWATAAWGVIKNNDGKHGLPTPSDVTLEFDPTTDAAFIVTDRGRGKGHVIRRLFYTESGFHIIDTSYIPGSVLRTLVVMAWPSGSTMS